MAASSVSIALERFTTFGDLLKYMRRCTGLTQRELSIAVGYSEAQISRLEQNERMPDIATIAARFLPVLQVPEHPELADRLLELAGAVRREDAPAVGLAPYKGLFYFTEADTELFFGREALVTRLVDALFTSVAANQRFLAVVGASGSGKSSVVRAGLIPALRWQQPSSNWGIHVLTPSAHPLESLTNSLTSDTLPELNANQLIEEMQTSPAALNQVLSRCDNAAPNIPSVLIVVDQFEELFTLCRSEAVQAAFIANLLTAAFEPGGAAIIVIVMRADFYAHCARFDLLREALPNHQEFIGPMTRNALQCAIEEPARYGHWEIEPGLTDLLLHDIGADGNSLPEPGALPLLSHSLLETWQRRRGHTLTLSGYTASGGVRGAITETAESVYYDQFSANEREIARQIFIRLTELGGDAATADTRRRVNIDELAFKLGSQSTVQFVLKTLADARLVTIDQDSAEVAHEALIRAWPTLRGWLEDDREGLRLHRQLTEAAQDWEHSGREPSLLYRGARLAQAKEWAANRPDDLNLLELAFLDAAQNLADAEAAEREAQRQRELEAARQLVEVERASSEAQARANRGLRRLAGFLITALLIAGALLITSVVLGQRATRAENLSVSRELAAAAINNLSVDPERSVLLALQALSTSDTLEARNSLHQALPELHILRSLPAHQQAPGVAYSPDGTRLASIGTDGTAKIWDPQTGKLLSTLVEGSGDSGFTIAFSPDGTLLGTVWMQKVIIWNAATGSKVAVLPGNLLGPTIIHISFSPDSQRVAVANVDGTPIVWSFAGDGSATSIIGHNLMCDGVAYSPDGALLATGDEEGIVKIWDSETLQEVRSLQQSGVIHSVAFSPDGVRLATANEDGTLKIWETTTGRELLSLPRMSGLYDVIFMPDNQRIVTTHQDGTTRIWDAQSGQMLLTLAGHISTVVGVASHPGGDQIATAGYDGTVKIWDPNPGKEILTMAAHKDQVWDVRYSPDGTRLASASLDGTLKIWDPVTGTLLHSLEPGTPFTALAFSPDGTWLGAGSLDGPVYLWKTALDLPPVILTGHNGRVVDLAFSPGGQRLVTTSWDATARVWDLAQKHEIVVFTGHGNAGLIQAAFSPDGTRVYTSGGFEAREWEAATGEELAVYSADDREIYGLAVSPDGSRMAIGLQDGEILVWDTAERKIILRLAGHAGLVFRLAFSPDGTRLASASFDGYAKIWDIAAGEEQVTLYGSTSNVFGADFHPNGTQLAAAGGDGSVRTYTLQMDSLIHLAQERVTRGLNAEECRKYLHGDCP